MAQKRRATIKTKPTPRRRSTLVNKKQKQQANATPKQPQAEPVKPEHVYDLLTENVMLSAYDNIEAKPRKKRKATRRDAPSSAVVQDYVRRICIAASALIIFGCLAYTTFERSKLIERSNTVSTPESVIETVNAADVTSFSATDAKRDEDGRYYVDASIASNSDVAYNVHVTANVTCSGTDKRGSDWSGVLNNLKFSSDTPDCVWTGNDLAIINVEPGENRTVRLYPDFSEMDDIDGVTIDAIEKIEFITQDASPTEQDTSLISTAHASDLSCRFNTDGSVLTIYGTAETPVPHATSGKAYIVLIDKYGDKTGTLSRERVSFPFSTKLVEMPFECDTNDSQVHFSTEVATEGDITRAKLVAIVMN